MLARTRRLLLTLLAIGTLAGCSTDQICSDACQIWEDRCSYSDYTYGLCFDDCKYEGDWSSMYLSCIEAANNCGQVEDCG